MRVSDDPHHIFCNYLTTKLNIQLALGIVRGAGVFPTAGLSQLGLVLDLGKGKTAESGQSLSYHNSLWKK